jgi:hypothetical protein
MQIQKGPITINLPSRDKVKGAATYDQKKALIDSKNDQLISKLCQLISLSSETIP